MSFKCFSITFKILLYNIINNNTDINSISFARYNNILYLGCHNGKIYKYINGNIKRIYKGYDSISYIVIYDNYIYAGTSEGKIIQLDLNGNVKYTYHCHHETISSIIVFNECIYSCSYDGTLVKLGEFYLRDYRNLPNTSKTILFEAAKVFHRLNIEHNIYVHKDIRIMIFRKLL